MSYLARLKKLKNAQIGSVKSTKTDNYQAPALPEEGDAPPAVASPVDGGTGKQPVIGDGKNLETPQVGSIKSTKTNKVVPAYIKRCDVAKPPPSKPATPMPAEERLHLPVLTCSNCGSAKLEHRVYTSVCGACGQIDERCTGCDMVMRDSDIECRGCGRALV